MNHVKVANFSINGNSCIGHGLGP